MSEASSSAHGKLLYNPQNPTQMLSSQGSLHSLPRYDSSVHSEKHELPLSQHIFDIYQKTYGVQGTILGPRATRQSL